MTLVVVSLCRRQSQLEPVTEEHDQLIFVQVNLSTYYKLRATKACIEYVVLERHAGRQALGFDDSISCGGIIPYA